MLLLAVVVVVVVRSVVVSRWVLVAVVLAAGKLAQYICQQTQLSLSAAVVLVAPLVVAMHSQG